MCIEKFIMYRANFYESCCLRCGQIVYQVDRVGPLKDFTFFHSGCFKCAVCGTKLTLKTYYNNQHSQEDKEVYCSGHVPKIGPGHLDGTSVIIRTALNVPKASNLNERSTLNGTNNVGQTLNTPQLDYQYGRFDASALHIAHALRATELHKAYNKAREKPIEFYLDKDEQTRLEMKHRKEEDDLYRKFIRQREEEDRRIKNEIRDEWEKELERLISRFEKEMTAKKKRSEDTKVLTLRLQQERDDLEKNMTLRRERKKESLTRKLLEHERAATAALVEKQSREMLELINEKRSQYMMAESIYLEPGAQEELAPYPSRAPSPAPPSLAKYHIYSHPNEFAQIDEIAISVAQEDQKTFTDLVRQLVGRCGSDIEKARTIFRWITVKNLNTMQFDENLRGDTPMGLLRGIKHGTESYHVLFKRLCSYAGLHCVVIKGYSKSAGYQPGISFEDNRFRNSWNAVFVAGSWRFVQCNWGARHLVNAKEVPKTGSKLVKTDSLRYEYDDHYFLTDPREFIYEFFPLQPEWQLLKTSISLQDFEELPFVRSLFFRYCLYFPDNNTKAVMYTDATGAATVRIAMPSNMQSSLIFHYNLKFYDSDGDSYDGVSLKRFVMQSVVGNIVSFRVHAPSSGSFLLDIFANAVTPREYLTGEPMKFKSVCKFKIVCEDLQTVMVPLPDCASGEWGPTKATRLFGLIPVTHQEALIFAGRELEIQFRMSCPLTDFMATLHKNGLDSKRLSKYVMHRIIESDEIVIFQLTFPEEGQYGLDIYTRDFSGSSSNEKHLLTHSCKYLINSSKRN
ncbi:peptidase hillarin isoform X1 [Rhodnius prolixus]